MILSKYFSSISNFKILCSSVTMKPINFAILGKHCNRANNNIVLVSMKAYSDRGKQISDEKALADKKSFMTEENRIRLQKWVEMCRFQGDRVPNNISEEQFLELFENSSELLKKKYLNFLVIKEAAQANDRLLREKKKVFKAEKQNERMNRPHGHIEYGLWRNAIFAKSNKRHIIDLYHHRLASAMIHGQPLVMDLGFDDYMQGREIVSYAEQLGIAVSLNRSNDDPFNLTFCNVNFKSKPFYKFSKFMSSVMSPSFPMNITSKSYLELFPKNKLVYLSPNAREVMREYDHDAIYVIGGIVDIRRQQPLTLSIAKQEKIRVQRLPLDKYHIFKASKNLSFHVVVAILLDLKKDGDWKKALYNIPKRLIETADENKHVSWDSKRRPW